MDKSARTQGSPLPMSATMEGRIIDDELYVRETDVRLVVNEAMQRARIAACARDDANLEMLVALKKAFDILGSEALDGVFAFCAVHGYRYSGPTINIDELRTAIAKAELRT